MKVLVCGGREYNDLSGLYATLDWENLRSSITMVIHGGARGADSLAGAWARERGIQEVICPANWDRNGKSAGVIRNSNMLLLNPDLVVAFPGGKGTANMVKLAKAAGVLVDEVTS